ncbi:MAG: ABC transporter ATP-binding protein [Planctomycetes bacterium]|nr:ABC transporter ATP-binding protein [Planctomycetota bacterium]
MIVEDLGKCYRIYPDATARVKETLSFGRRKFHEEKWAFRGVGFELLPGQALGVVGINGAGKSTLLKILTGTSRQTEGRYETIGTVSSLLELGAGFHPEFTGRDNIYMNALIQGVPRKKVDEQFEAIAAFSELGEYLDRPVRTYSSGMAMRLGFSASMLVNPNILILDEVLAVGDARFQKKCMDKFIEFRSADKTIIFVSHSVYHVREICDRAIWLHDGKVVMDADPVSVTDEYETRILEHIGSLAVPEGMDMAVSHGLAKIDSLELSRPRETGERLEYVTGEPLTITMKWHNPEREKGVFPIIAVIRNDGLLVFSTRPSRAVRREGEMHEAVLTIPSLQLLAGEYSINAYITDETGAHIMDQRLSACRFKVAHAGAAKGIFLADAHWADIVDHSVGPSTPEPGS